MLISNLSTVSNLLKETPPISYFSTTLLTGCSIGILLSTPLLFPEVFATFKIPVPTDWYPIISLLTLTYPVLAALTAIPS